MADASITPVVLRGWPSSQNNLAWSDDYLAVAADELIHILAVSAPSNQAEPSRHDYQLVDTIRINQFTDEEWPLVDLAPISSLSLGEEQSQSSACSLAWSTVEIGIHKRNVLAVLTTNQRLSLWETTGNPGSWRRMCIINNLLSIESGKLSRKLQRIRAFAWLPALQVTADPRRDKQYLVKIDDEDNVSVIYITASHSSHTRKYKATIAFEMKLSEQELSTENHSPLQKLLQKSPVSKIKCGKWQKLMDENGSVSLLRLRIAFEKGSAGLTCSDLVLSCEPSQNDVHIHGHVAPHVTSTQSTVIMPPSSDFETTLVQPMNDFDEKHGLHGNVRTRHWGFAQSSDGTQMATCVSFHPSDNTTVTLREAEQCVVLVKATGVEALSGHPVTTNPKIELLRWIAGHRNVNMIKTGLDVKIMRVAAASVDIAFVLDAGLVEWLRAAEELAASFRSASDAEDETHQFVPALSAAESCEMCDSAISISRDLSSGRCAQGHTFARCGISFLAIQEPGISKYCSRCGKQFLDILKLEPQQGPSLSLSLFEEFDVCPYCRGKFRG